MATTEAKNGCGSLRPTSAACDFAFLRHFYATGERLPFRSFWKDGQPALAPLPVPDFEPTRWKSRYEGIVV